MKSPQDPNLRCRYSGESWPNSRAAERTYCGYSREYSKAEIDSLEVVNNNYTKIAGVMLKDNEDLDYVGVCTVFDGETEGQEQFEYRSTAIVDWRNGRIMAVGKLDSLDPEVVHAEHAVQLQMNLLLSKNTDGKTIREYGFSLPEDRATEFGSTLETCLAGKALENLELTVDICNSDNLA
jgi:hypothetical protein